MRHMLITVPVLILLSIVACGDDTERETIVQLPGGDEAVLEVERDRDRGRAEIEVEQLERAIDQDDRDEFVLEANEDLDEALLELDRVAPMAGSEGTEVRRAIEARITEARADVALLGTATEEEWPEVGRRVVRSLQVIEGDIERLEG